MNQKKKEQEKGITLIALVITIIVLLILAAISIATLTGENGVLTKASDSKTQTQIAEIKELAKTDIFEIQAKNESGNITKDQLKTVLEKYFNEVPEELPDDITDLELMAKEEYGEHKVKVSDIWNGTFASNKVTFTIECSDITPDVTCDLHSTHGGTFEVKKGTTWEEFFSENFANDWYGWLYHTEDERVMLYEQVIGAANVFCYELVNSNENPVKKNEIITER